MLADKQSWSSCPVSDQTMTGQVTMKLTGHTAKCPCSVTDVVILTSHNVNLHKDFEIPAFYSKNLNLIFLMSHYVKDVEVKVTFDSQFHNFWKSNQTSCPRNNYLELFWEKVHPRQENRTMQILWYEISRTCYLHDQAFDKKLFFFI